MNQTVRTEYIKTDVEEFETASRHLYNIKEMVRTYF